MDGLPVTRGAASVLESCGAAGGCACSALQRPAAAGTDGGPPGTRARRRYPGHRARDRGNQPVPRQLQQADHRNPAHQHHQPRPDGPRRGTDQPALRGPVTWPASAGGIELPPGQAKSLPAPLPAPDCSSPAATSAGPGDASARPVQHSSPSAWSTPEGAAPPTSAAPVLAADPFGVLARNNAEMCVALEAAKVATIRMAPELEVSADGRTAVVRLLMTPRPKPRDGGGAADAGATGLVIDRIEETTLLAESPVASWPRGVTAPARRTTPRN